MGNVHVKSFEEVFKKQRGVNFDDEAVADCAEKAEQFATIKTAINMIDMTKEMLGYATRAGSATTEIRVDIAAEEILRAFQACGITDGKEIAQTLSDIAEKYFAQILQMKSDNLKVTSRTLLFLAILLKLKSNSLVGIEFEQFESVDVDYDDEFTDDWGDDIAPTEQLPTNNVISLNEVLERRTSTRLNRNRVVTLQDLIKQLEFYEQLDKKVALRNTLERAKRRVRSYANFSTEDIVNLAHDEYIKDSVDKLHENLIKIFESEERVNIQTLTLLGLDKISVYIGLLFLSVDTDYELVQDEFYSDVFVTNSPIVTPVIEDEQTA
jgi:segregation and condensation protein A